MGILQWFIIIAIAFVIAAVYLTVIAGKRIHESVAEYYIAGQSVGPFVLVFTVFASLVSAFGMLGLPGFAYVHGVMLLPFMLIVDGLFIILMYTVAYRMWLLSKGFGYISPVEMLGDRYESKGFPVFAALILIAFVIPFMAVQMIGISYVINTLIGKAIPVWINYTIVAALIFVFTIVGGMRSVAWTDTLMGVVMFIAIVSMAILFPYKAFGGFSEMFSLAAQKMPNMLSVPGGIGKLSFLTFTSMSFAWLGFFIVQPHMTQRYMIAKSHKSIMTVGWGVAICVFFLTIMAVFIGVGGKLLYPTIPKADQIMLKVMSEFAPPFLGATIIMGIIAASITTVDSQLMALTSIWSRDIYRALFKARAKTTQGEEILVGRLGIIGLLIITIIFSLFKLPMMALLVLLSTAGVATLAPAVMGGFFWRKSSAAGAYWSTSIGVIVLVLLELEVFAAKPFLSIHSGVWSLVAATLVFVVVSPLTKQPGKKAEAWISYLDSKFGVSPPASQVEKKKG